MIMQYKIKSRIWIEVDNEMFLGEGRVKLLKAIQETGSLSKAAKAINISYNKAWKLIDSVNKAAKELVVIKNTGGKGGGGAIVTDYGENLISSFDSINKNCWKFLDKQATKLTL